MNNPTGPETVAAANALSGECSFATLTYPVTGYAECDAITAILTLLKDIPCRRAQRIGEYIAARFKDCADEQDRNRLLPNAEYVGHTLAGSALTQASPTPMPYWTSTGVVDELARQAITPQQQSDFLDRIRRWGQEAKSLPNSLP